MAVTSASRNGTVPEVKDAPKKDSQARNNQQILKTLELLGGKAAGDDTVLHQGDRVILPENLSTPEAIVLLNKVLEAEEKPTRMSRTFKFRPWDGAYAFAQVAKEYFGLLLQKDTMTMFGRRPPQLIDIEVAPGVQAQVPWGNAEIGVLKNCTITLGGDEDAELGPLFALHVEGPRKYRPAVQGLFNLVQDYLEKHSIYRGKSFDASDQPKFIDTAGVNRAFVVYPRRLEVELRANIWTLLEHTQAQRDHKLSLKRAVLLHGRFGTGKTTTATLTGQIANANGWTFIYVRPGRDDISRALQTARLYQPCVVFMEDLDVVTHADMTSDQLSMMLDAFDGMNAKGVEILGVLTTNHLSKLHKGMLRPGRLDAVIEVDEYDADSIERLLRALSSQSLDHIDFGRVVQAGLGLPPAFIKEASDRALRYNIARNNGVLTQIDTDDYVYAMQQMKAHMALMEENSDHLNSNKLDTRVSAIVKDQVEVVMKEHGF